MPLAWNSRRRLRVLDFDIENRPLNYAGDDFTFSEVTAVAAAFTDEPERIAVWALGEVSAQHMLGGFLAMYDAADIVTGHNILKHDLPILNGMSLELGGGPLSSRLTSDTYKHLKRRSGVSGSQESLADMLGLESPKVGMSHAAWREANRLTPAGIAKTKARVVGDVVQHMELRARLLELGWLGPPRAWTP